MSRRKALKSISFLWVGSVLGAGCAFFSQVLLARELGPEKFGLFASALAVVVLVSPLAGCGIGSFWLKVFGQEGWRAIRWLSGSFKYVILTTSLVFAGIIFWALLGPHDETTQFLLLILSLHLLAQVMLELGSAKLQLEERYTALAFWHILPHFLRLLSLASFTFLMAGWLSLYNVGYLYASISASVLIAGILLIWNMPRGGLSLKGHFNENVPADATKPRTDEVLAKAWPFGMAGIFHLIYFQSDIVILKYIKGDEVAGTYNVVFVIMSAVYILPSVVYQKFLMPKIHRWAENNRDKFYEVYRRGNWAMLLLGLLSMLLVWLLAPWGVTGLFGEDYSAAVIPLCLIALAAPFRFVASSVGSTLVTQENIRIKVAYMGLAAFLNLILNFLLIPGLGLLGAVFSTIASEIFLLMLYFRGAKLVFSERARL